MIRSLNHANVELLILTFSEGVPATMFGVADVSEEYNRLIKQGVRFTIEPTEIGDVTLAVFDDTCGNFIQIEPSF